MKRSSRRKTSPKRERVSFTATKQVAKPVKVFFTTKSGEKVSFKAVKRVSTPVRVTFYRKRKKK